MGRYVQPETERVALTSEALYFLYINKPFYLRSNCVEQLKSLMPYQGNKCMKSFVVNKAEMEHEWVLVNPITVPITGSYCEGVVDNLPALPKRKTKTDKSQKYEQRQTV